jgi:hypothetical protein
MERPQTSFLFDLDGTRVDSVYQHVLAWHEALETEGIMLSIWRIHRWGSRSAMTWGSRSVGTNLPGQQIIWLTAIEHAGWSRCRHLISTTANYLSFPTQKRNFGYRLDNTEILSSGFGALSNHHLSEKLRVGDETLADLSSKTRRKKHRNLRKHQNPAEVAQAFAYWRAGVERDFNRGAQLQDSRPNGRIHYLEHIKLLWKYASCPVLANEYIDVHRGYFKGAVTQNIPMIAWPCFRVTISRFCYLPKGKTTGSFALAIIARIKAKSCIIII